MPKALETFHHALGTVQEGTDLPESHPIVLAARHLFAASAPTVHAEAPVRPVKAAKGPKG